MPSTTVIRRLLVTAWLGLITASAQAQLQTRDVDADGSIDAFYDTQLNITWLADMDFANTSITPCATMACST